MRRPRALRENHDGAQRSNPDQTVQAPATFFRIYSFLAVVLAIRVLSATNDGNCAASYSHGALKVKLKRFNREKCGFFR